MVPYTLDLPTNRKKLGDVLHWSIQQAKELDLAPVWTQSMAVQAYLRGDRSFEIEDPYRPGNIVLIVENPRDTPSWETLVSDVSEEVGRQLRMDPTPTAVEKDLSINALRDAAVSRGLLAHLFPQWDVDNAHRAFQRNRVHDGCGGLVVYECMKPNGKWGVRLRPIPIEELIFLPVGVRTWDQVEMIVWRKWVTLSFLKKFVADYYTRTGKVMKLPSVGDEDFKNLMMRYVPSGSSPREMTRTMMPFSARGASSADSGGTWGEPYDKTGRVTGIVELVQGYVTTNQRHAERVICMAGKHILHDHTPDKPRIIPIGTGRYADTGTPYGRSYAFPRMMATLFGERFLTSVARNSAEIDAYGMIMLSSQMGFELSAVEQPGQGARFMQYTRDPGSPDSPPLQFKPMALGQVYGGLIDYMANVHSSVFPSSPIFQGKSAGRVDSDAAYKRLDILSNTQIAAGAISGANAYAQVYAAGQEMAKEHYEEGDEIPLTYVSEDMAGIMLDSIPVPKSSDERNAEKQMMEMRAGEMMKRGIVPALSRAYTESQNKPETPVSYVPVGRFTVGRNVIPHPDDVAIHVTSVMPRDKDAELQQLFMANKMGGMSMMEVQVEAYKRGLAVPLGGRDVINAYQTVVLNLLSAFGDGIEAGPIMFTTTSRLWRVGQWLIQTFMESPAYMTASETVKAQIGSLANMYSPVNTPPNVLTAEESAMQHDMVMRARAAGQMPGAIRNAGPPNGSVGQMGGLQVA